MKLGPGLEGGSGDRALAVGVLPPPIRGGHNTLNGGFRGPLFLYDMGHLDWFHLAPSMHGRSQEPHTPPSPITELGSPLQGWVALWSVSELVLVFNLLGVKYVLALLASAPLEKPRG